MQAREIGDTIKLMKLVIFYQLRYDIVGLTDVCRTRKFAKTVKSKSRIPIPVDESKDCLETLLDPLLDYLDNKIKVVHDCIDADNVTDHDSTGFKSKNMEEDYEKYFEVGSKVKIKWTSNEIGNSGWKPGWYVAEVQSSSIGDDEISVVYVSEPDCVYTVEVVPLLAQGKLR